MNFRDFSAPKNHENFTILQTERGKSADFLIFLAK